MPICLLATVITISCLLYSALVTLWLAITAVMNGEVVARIVCAVVLVWW